LSWKPVPAQVGLDAALAALDGHHVGDRGQRQQLAARERQGVVAVREVEDLHADEVTRGAAD
jgi:hypothetical protein